MDPGLRLMLDSLPPARRRSKLEPYAAVIRVLRTRGRSYREIVRILRERCGVSVGVHTVYHFVQRHTRKMTAPRRARRVLPPEGQVDVWTRMAALKQRGPARVTTPKAWRS